MKLYDIVRKNEELYRKLWAFLYNYIARHYLSSSNPIVFMNYGYFDPVETEPIRLNKEDEDNRIYIQLYHQVAGAVDGKGKDLLEISCGHGGGASYISRYLKPSSYIGVDLTRNAIEFCQKTHRFGGLRFQVDDALNLSFRDKLFDVVINVEASHCYSNFTRFISEVYRVLKPGGYFLYADYRYSHLYDEWMHDIKASGLIKVEEDDITANVVFGMEKNGQLHANIIARITPYFLRSYAYQFAGVKGSVIHKDFRDRRKIYIRFVFQRPDRDTGSPV